MVISITNAQAHIGGSLRLFLSASKSVHYPLIILGLSDIKVNPEIVSDLFALINRWLSFLPVIMVNLDWSRETARKFRNSVRVTFTL